MKKYAFNDVTHEMLSVYASQPSGSLLIAGVEGSGITTAISYIMRSTYGIVPKPGEVIFLEQPYTIENVRNLIHLISRTRSNSQKPRLVIIDDANKLKLDAQNTLLKSIEEPPSNTHFIIGTNHPEELLKTIVSRCQRIDLKRPLKSDLKLLFKHLEDSEFEKLYIMSDGWPGVLDELTNNKDSVYQKEVTSAKDFLSKNRVNKVGHLISLKTSDELIELVNGLSRISRAALRTATAKSDQEKNWLRIYKLCDLSLKQIKSGTSYKVVGLNLGSNI